MVENAAEKMKPICYLCGKRLAETSDHIFPKNLFPRPAPSNLPTAPSCMRCNNCLSNDEELFRTFVASGMVYETPSGSRIWNERIRPSLQHNRRGFKTLLQSLVKKEGLFSSQGAYLGDEYVLEISPGLVSRVMSKIAKGLYYLDTSEPLPDNVKLLSKYAGDNPQELIDPPLDDAIQGAKRADLGENVVTYWRNIIEGDPTSSLIWLVFYGKKWFFICTYREELLL